MKALLLALVLSACVVEGDFVPDRYQVCEDTAAPVAFCDSYYVWVGPYYSWPYNVWHPGHYEVRGGFRRPGHWARPPYYVRDHRHP